MTIKKIPKNVCDFIKKSSQIYSDHKEDFFSSDIYGEIKDLKITSPIEQILYCALKTIRDTNFMENGDVFDLLPKDLFVVGLGIIPQIKTGKFRCDFQVYYGSNVFYKNNKLGQSKYKDVYVECDSQEFHERTEEERRYEKQRDRYIQSNGGQILHFTGSEIVKDPYAVASEVISFVTGIDKDSLLSSVNI